MKRIPVVSVFIFDDDAVRYWRCLDSKQAYAQPMLNYEAPSKGCAAYVVVDDAVWVNTVVGK